MAGRWSDRVAGTILLALAVWYWIAAGGYTVAFSDPAGPSLFPRMIAVPLGLLALYPILRPDPDPSWLRWPQALGQAATLATLLLYPFILEPMGFPLATTLATAALSRILGGTWLQAVMCGLVVGFGLYVLFNYGFGLPLPVGPIFG